MFKTIKLNQENFNKFLVKYRNGYFGDKPIGCAIDFYFSLVGQNYLYYETNEDRAIKYIQEIFKNQPVNLEN
jgi:hypothetical protein